MTPWPITPIKNEVPAPVVMWPRRTSGVGRWVEWRSHTDNHGGRLITTTLHTINKNELINIWKSRTPIHTHSHTGAIPSSTKTKLNENIFPKCRRDDTKQDWTGQVGLSLPDQSAACHWVVCPHYECNTYMGILLALLDFFIGAMGQGIQQWTLIVGQNGLGLIHRYNHRWQPPHGRFGTKPTMTFGHQTHRQHDASSCLPFSCFAPRTINDCKRSKVGTISLGPVQRQSLISRYRIMLNSKPSIYGRMQLSSEASGWLDLHVWKKMTARDK